MSRQLRTPPRGAMNRGGLSPRRISPEQVCGQDSSELRGELRHVLASCLQPSSQRFMDELGITGAHSVVDLMYLQPRAADNLRCILEVPKIKMCNLVELMYKDSRADAGMLNAIGVHYKLEEIKRNKREATELENEEDQ